jgi:hypothetical protein
LRDLSLGVAIARGEIPATVLLPEATRGRKASERISAVVDRERLLFTLTGHLIKEPERGVFLCSLSQTTLEHRQFLLIFLLQLSLDAFILNQLCFLLFLPGSPHVPI